MTVTNPHAHPASLARGWRGRGPPKRVAAAPRRANLAMAFLAMAFLAASALLAAVGVLFALRLLQRDR